MRFLNPKTDFAFKKIFGSDSSKDILISFLNAILDLSGKNAIDEITIVDPYLAPKIDGMKASYLDVRVKDQWERSYIVEMQILNVDGFEKRVLYNACKTYVGQLEKGEAYADLVEVVAVTITDFIMFPELERVVSRFRMRAEENPLIVHQDLELVFAELPKLVKTVSDLETTIEKWLYFLKHAKELSVIPKSLAIEPAIVQAFEKANRASWTEEELDAQEKREFWIYDQRTMVDRAARRAQALGEAKGRAEGRAEGKAKGKTEMLLRLLLRRFRSLPRHIEDRIQKATNDQLDEWSERFVDATSLNDIFEPHL
ncbi:transposase [Azospirillaceae bacterium]